MEINGYTDYLIYNDGRVWSKKGNRFKISRINKSGYEQVNLSKEGNCKTHNIHRLIAEHYISNTENKKCVDHINRIRTDNRVENLRWATYSENSQNRSATNNTSGHIYVSYIKSRDSWKFKKSINNKRTVKQFKSKTDALCYKFIIMLKVKAKLS